jgi:hypothetical protein
MLSREEKKNKVIDMHKKEKSIRQIAKAVHMSFGEIGRIIKEEFPEEQIQPTLQQSKYTQALQLFEAGKSLFEVAVALHLTYDEVLKIYKDYLKLKNHDKLINVYQDLGDNIEPFLTLHEKLNQSGKTPQDAMIISNHLDQLNSLRLSCYRKSSEVTQLNLNIQTLSGSYQELHNQQSLLVYYNNILKGQNYNLSLTKHYLLSDNSQIQSSIQYLNSVGPAIIKDVAGTEINSILACNRETLTLAAAALFQAIAQDPSGVHLFNSISLIQSNNPAEQTYYRNKFMDLAERVYENLALSCAQKIFDSVQRKHMLEPKTMIS